MKCRKFCGKIVDKINIRIVLKILLMQENYLLSLGIFPTQAILLFLRFCLFFKNLFPFSSFIACENFISISLLNIFSFFNQTLNLHLCKFGNLCEKCIDAQMLPFFSRKLLKLCAMNSTNLFDKGGLLSS